MKQLLLPAGIPWYRTRLFWGIIFGAIFVYAGFNFYLFISSASSISILSTNQILMYVVFSSGAALPFLLGAVLGKTGSWVLSGLFYVIVGVCFYKTFHHKRVQIRYPILFLILFVLGIGVGSLYLSGL